MTDPDQVLANYEGTLAEAQRRSDAIRETLATLQVTERSADGQISVTVNDAGNLVDLELGNALQRREGDAVSREVLRVVRAAQGRVAATVQEAMAPLIGVPKLGVDLGKEAGKVFDSQSGDLFGSEPGQQKQGG